MHNDTSRALPVRVILDDRPLRNALTGVGNYIAQLLLHASRAGAEFRLTPFLHDRLLRRDWRSRLTPPPAPVGAPRATRAGGRVPWTLRRAAQSVYAAAFRAMTRGYALYHEPNHVPMSCDLPTVTTIHDLSVLVHPEWHPGDRVKWYERDFERGVRQTRHFLAASEFTRREMTQRLGIDPRRITVTYQAPRAAFHPPIAPAAGEASAIEHPERFFLFVGTLEPRKNVDGLLEAYAALPRDVRRDHPLLIAGAWGWKADLLRARLADRSLSADVRLLGYLHDPALARLYAACTALVWPTWYEGFGLPPLEAMACGAPVLTSDVASLPEVVGDAGVLLDPRDASAWTQAMTRVAQDAAHRETLRRRGPAQAARFQWNAFIDSTFAGYHAALHA